MRMLFSLLLHHRLRSSSSSSMRSTMLLRSFLVWLVIGAVAGQGKTTRSYNRAGKAEPPARPNSYFEEQVPPIFDNTTNRNVTTQLGKTAYLHCRVKNLGDKTAYRGSDAEFDRRIPQVSWIRHRDLHILTVGRYTYTSDQRFQAIHLEQSEDWTLQIKYPQKRDAGSYECQVSTEPKISMFVNLNVVDQEPWFAVSSTSKPPVRRPKNTVATATILGHPDLYIKSGSTINLTCIITQSPQPPTFLFWYHNDKVINYDSRRGGISVETEKAETTQSRLLITSAKTGDSGNYTCNPSNADAVSIMVHVLNGEKPEAIQHGGASSRGGGGAGGAIITSTCLLLLLSWTHLVPPVVR